MVHAKNYETVSDLLKLSGKKRGLFFSGHGDGHCLTALSVINTRSSATAEKQRVSYACLPRLANSSCNAQNTAESQRLYYF